MQECKKCGSKNIRIGVATSLSGSTIHPYYCEDCGETQKQYASKAEAQKVVAAGGVIKAILTNTQKHQNYAKHIRHCEVCQSQGAELHHWAPSYLFGADSERWPKSYLCVSCHKQWHQIVTPNMSTKP